MQPTSILNGIFAPRKLEKPLFGKLELSVEGGGGTGL